MCLALCDRKLINSHPHPYLFAKIICWRIICKYFVGIACRIFPQVAGSMCTVVCISMGEYVYTGYLTCVENAPSPGSAKHSFLKITQLFA